MFFLLTALSLFIDAKSWLFLLSLCACIDAAIDFENRRMSVTLNGKEYYMNYLESIGYMVAIDGHTGNVKFFQAKGYGYRGEEAGELLRGKKFAGKNVSGPVNEL